MATILVVEDNERLATGLRSNLEFEGYRVVVAGTAQEGLAQARDARPDLILLDLMLPDADGYRVLRDLRERGDDVPVLVLTALGEEADKVRGFRFGADDYVTKPFGLMELLARVDALLRRARREGREGREAGAGTASPAAAASTASLQRFGDVVVDASTRTVRRDGREVALRPKEFELLCALLERNGELATRLDLLREVWGYDDSVMSRTVDTHIAELRRKLERDPSSPRHILTVLKVGYRLQR
ncbi:MAG: response regulator transcription factor [Gemmatimonadaceae bacterium]|nr:response regulator transcription factor [Gemmatimonadaceae bacterium]